MVIACLPVVSRYVLWIEWVTESTAKGVWTSMSLFISTLHLSTKRRLTWPLQEELFSARLHPPPNPYIQSRMVHSVPSYHHHSSTCHSEGRHIPWRKSNSILPELGNEVSIQVDYRQFALLSWSLIWLEWQGWIRGGIWRWRRSQLHRSSMPYGLLGVIGRLGL